MKKYILSFLLPFTFLLTGCLEITQELTINKNGSGTLANTTDMSEFMAMAIQMAGDKIGEEKLNVDTIIPFHTLLDSAKEMTAADKQLLKNGKVHAIMKMNDGKYVVSSSIPFQSVGDVEKINRIMQNDVAGKLLDNAMKEAMKQAGKEDSSLDGNQKAPEMSLPDNYFTLTCKDGLITRVADKGKLANLESDQMMAQMKQASAMGSGLKTNFVLNLPRPAKKAEGKNVILSEDKKKITVSNELNDLFEDPSLYEFRIEY